MMVQQASEVEGAALYRQYSLLTCHHTAMAVADSERTKSELQELCTGLVLREC